jgi:predicted dehydrogenase
VCDLNPQTAAGLADQLGVERRVTDYDAVVEADDIDAVVVATPPPVHVPMSIAALGVGKHVLSEVPALWKAEEAEDLVRAAAASTAQYMMAENMAYFAWVQTFESMVRQGFIGEPVYAECEYVHHVPSLMVEEVDGEIRPTWRARLGPAQYCTHDLGPILGMFDDRVDTVVGMSTGCVSRPDLGTTDGEVILCKTVKGRVIKFLGTFLNRREPALHYFSLYGTKGVLESPRMPEQSFRVCSDMIPNTHGMASMPLSDSHPSLVGQVPGGGHGTCEWLMVDDFVRAIEAGEKPPIDVMKALDWSLPGVLGHMSAEAGSVPMRVPDPREWHNTTEKVSRGA